MEAGFKGQIIGFHDEQILYDTIHAAVPFKDITPVNIFNVQPECAGENTKNEKFHIKISQGCLKTCTFCIINKAKGYITSIPFETIERQVRKAVKLGIKKIHLMGEDTFAYGVDSGTTIIELVEKIKAIDPELEISFGYLHAKWLKKYAKEINAFCKQGILTELQIGLQHIDEEILESMGRPIDFAEIYEMICNIKKENPGFYFIADILVGFPGETDEMFEKLMEFFKKDKCFNKVKHFAYSDVKGTPSSRMDTKLPQHVIAERWQRLDNNLGDRAYSTEAEEARIDNETFKKTRFDDYFFCKDTFDEELDGVIAQRELAFAQPGVLKDDEGDFGF